jgi:hypothetical protein
MDRDDALPTWWFEVDEDDDVDTNTPLLQELEIDLPLIYRCAMWMLLGPLGCHYGRNAAVHPLSTMLSGGVTSPLSSSSSSSLHGGTARSLYTSTHASSSGQSEKPPDGLTQRGSYISSILAPSSSSASVTNPPSSAAAALLLTTQRGTQTTHIDFWGPCLVVSVYGALLWLDRVRDVPWLYVIWSTASLFNHFVCRVFYKPSKLLAHYSLLGNAPLPSPSPPNSNDKCLRCEFIISHPSFLCPSFSPLCL